MKSGTTMSKGMKFMAASKMTRGGPISRTKKRTRSSTMGQTAGVRSMAKRTHRGPLNSLG